MACQRRYVAAARPQWRNVAMDDIQAIIEILAEPTAGNILDQIVAGRSDDAHVRDLRDPAADPLEFSGVESMEQLDLHVERQRSHLLEEQRVALGLFELPGGAIEGAGERAFFMAEQCRFDSIGRRGAAM